MTEKRFYRLIFGESLNGKSMGWAGLQLRSWAVAMATQIPVVVLDRVR